MSYVSVFLSGMAMGAVGAAWALVVTFAMHPKPLFPQDSCAFRNAEKLAKARNRLGQIARFKSIDEAREIANIALKELGQ